MPLFMDRHDIPGVTAEDAAQAHVNDMSVEAKYGVHFLAYWFDPDQAGVFCLADAPTADTLEAVHRDAHGQIPNRIIAVSEDSVLKFLGRIVDPAGSAAAPRPFRAILFTDLEGSTALLHELGEASFMVVLTEHDLVIRRALVATHGREVKHTGDGIMAAFDDVPSALRCAVAIQEGFATRVADGSTPDLQVRIGVAAGEPVDRDDDLFGTTVNLASRICATAEGGRILASDVVHDLGRGAGFAFDPGRDVALKGFGGPVRVYEVIPPGPPA